ncbi:MAG: adenosylhomocysteinase [Thermoleophilaceae bacterium]|nr:adenosylhomocysteinase [Thermoleophilaceae bacterium]
MSALTEGERRIEWAGGQMPVLRQVGERLAAEQPLAGLHVGACLHVTPETANLVRALRAGGATVALCASNPLSTQDDVAEALAGKGVEVFAKGGEEGYVGNVVAVIGTEPVLTLDDGADLLTAMHAKGLPDGFVGATEETTIGLVRVRALEQEGRLGCAVLAVNEARTERTFNDRYGTGQSALDGILRATNLLLAGKTIVVLGYGTTGQGIALRARGAGANVVVCEVDPLRALEARMDGYEVMPALKAAERGDVFICVTGGRDVLRKDHFKRMKDGALLANAGHFDVEIDLEALRAAAAGVEQVLPLVESYDLGDRRVNLLARGRVVNLAAAEGHPAEVMDISFALQALSAVWMATQKEPLPATVLPVPGEIDREVAKLKLDALGVKIDSLSAAQRKYLTSWRG